MRRRRQLIRTAVFCGGVGVTEILIGTYEISAGNLMAGAVFLILAAVIAAIAYRDDDNHKEEE